MSFVLSNNLPSLSNVKKVQLFRIVLEISVPISSTHSQQASHTMCKPLLLSGWAGAVSDTTHGASYLQGNREL